MRVFVYSCRTFDEDPYFEQFSREFGIELGICREAPTLENAHLAKGYDAISVITTKVDGALVEKFHEMGVKMISTRTIGYHLLKHRESFLHLDSHSLSSSGDPTPPSRNPFLKYIPV